MTVDYKSFPIAEIHDFDDVIVDVTRFEHNGHYFYVPLLNFFKQFADDETGQRGEGMVFITGIAEDTLREVHDKVETLMSTGFFGGVNVDGHGTLYDEKHDELGDICWLSYGDDEEGCGMLDEDDEIDMEMDKILLARGPSMLQ